MMISLFHCIQVTAQGPYKDHLVDIYDVRTLKKDRTILAGQNVGVLLPY